jgi:hypothetical protein
VSISAFQDKVFKSGCGPIVFAVSAIAMGFGFFYTSCGRGGGPSSAVPEEGLAAVKVGEASVSPDQVDRQSNQMLQQYGMQGAPNPRIQSFALAQALNASIQQLSYVEVANQMGLKLDDAAIKAFVTKQLDTEIATARTEYQDSGKLKAGFTEAQFNDQFKKEHGETPADFRTKILANVDESLADPDKHSAVIQQAAQQMVQDAAKAKLSATDAEVKASYDSFTFKRILLNPAGKTPADIQKLADKVLADLKGGASFETEMNKYSNDPPMAKKQVSDNTVVHRRPDLMSQPDMAVLATLKPGTISEAIPDSGGKAIYKLISVKNEAPPDYDKNPAKYKDQYLAAQASASVQKQIADVVKSPAVTYPLAGYKAVADLSQSMLDPGLSTNPGARSARLLEIAKEAEAATTDKTPGDEQAAAIVWYNAFEDAYATATDKSKLADDRLKMLQGVLAFLDSFDIRMAVVDMLAQKKDVEGVGGALINAATANNTYDATADQHFRQINDRLAQLKKDKLISDEAVVQVQKIQDRWRIDKAENDKEEKQMKAEQAKQKVEQAAAQKKLEDENKKLMEEEKKKAVATPPKK